MCSDYNLGETKTTIEELYGFHLYEIPIVHMDSSEKKFLSNGCHDTQNEQSPVTAVF